METGISKIFELSGSRGGITVKITVDEVYDALKNTSDVSVGMWVKSSAFSNYTYYLDGTLTLGGQTLVSMNSAVPTHHAYVKTLNTYVRAEAWNSGYTSSPWGMTGIAHNADGSKTLTLQVSIRGYTGGGGGGSGWSVSATETIELTTIAQASTIGASDANIGAVSTISVVRKSDAYTHSIAYQFGDLSGYIAADGSMTWEEVKLSAVSIPFAVPETFYGQIPEAASAVCTLTCKTYSGDTQIGQEQTATFTAAAAKDICAPVVSGTVVDTNTATKALTDANTTLVRYMSTALCTIQAEAKNGTTIASKSICAVAVEENTLEIPNVETEKFVFYAEDKRGFSSSVTVEPKIIPYVQLTANPAAKRTNPTDGTAVLTIKGNYYNGEFGKTSNSLTVKFKIGNAAYQEIIPTITDNSYEASVRLTGLDYQSSFEIGVEVTDKLQTLEKTTILGKGIPVFDWGEQDFAFHVPVGMNNQKVTDLAEPEADTDAATKAYVDSIEKTVANSLLDKMYPVGSIYLSYSHADPATLFGGTWERISNAFLWAAGADETIGETGGEAEHTLTLEEIPAHTHTVPNVKTTGSDSGGAFAESWGGGSGSRDIITGQTGDGLAHNNMPPYINVSVWRRTK